MLRVPVSVSDHYSISSLNAIINKIKSVFD